MRRGVILLIFSLFLLPIALQGQSCNMQNGSTVTLPLSCPQSVFFYDPPDPPGDCDFQLTENDSLITHVSYNAPLCEGDTMVLTCTNPIDGVTYHWWGPENWSATTTVPIVMIPNVSMANAGQYFLSLMGAGITVDTAHVNVFVAALPVVTLTSNHDTICSQTSVILTANVANNTFVRYLWLSGNVSDTTNSEENPLEVSPQTTTTYRVIATNEWECTSSTSKTITVRPLSDVSILGDSLMCLGDSILLTALFDNFDCSCHWNTGDTSHVIWVYPTEDADYEVSVTNNYGCTSSDTKHVDVLYGTHNVLTERACEVYIWHDQTYDTTGVYTYAYTNDEGCASVDTLYLSVNQNFQIDENPVMEDSCINGQLALEACNGNQVTLSAPEGYDSYRWNNGSASATATYTVNGTTTASCLVSTTDCELTLMATLLTQSGQPAVNSVIYDTICEGECYTDNFYNLPPQNEIGTHVFSNTFYNVNTCSGGCLTTTLYLTVQQHLYHIYDTACVGQNYNIFGLQLSDLTVGERLISRDFHRNNGCDSSVTLHLKVEPPFTISNTITGDTAVCRNGYDTYILPNANNFASFHWNVPEGVNVIGGQETPVVSLSFTDEAFTPAHITVIGTHLCGIDSVSLSVTHFPVYDIVIQDSICIGDEYHRYGFDLAQQDSAGLFTYTNSGTTIHGCDSVVTLQLKVNPTYAVNDSLTICASELPYTWNGVLFTEAGIQTTTLQTVNGCDSMVTMTLIVNPIYAVPDSMTICASELPYTWNEVEFTAAGTQNVTLQTINGCDSVVTKVLTVNPIYAVPDSMMICASELPYTWNDVVFTAAGSQNVTYQTVNGCDSVVTMVLTVNPTYAVPDSMIVCDTELPYTWNGVEFTAAGTQTATLQTINGCDSVVTMVLTVNPTYAVPDSMTICASELPYTWNEVEFTEAGIQTATLQTVNGCDSVVAMVLTVNPTYAVSDSMTICDSELPYIWNEIEFIDAGTQNVTLQTINGCDSVVTMVLTVNPTYAVPDSMIICDTELPYTWNEVEFTEAGTQNVTLQTVNGCDSVVTMVLTVNPTYAVPDSMTICDSELPYTWNGVEFTAEGTQTATLQTVNGCDSVVTMFLTVNPTYVVPDSMTICASELPYTWNGVEFTTAGTQTATLQTVNGCDSVVTMVLTVNPTYAVPDSMTICDSELPYTWNEIEFTEAGTQTVTLQTVNGCDSVVTMVLTVNPTYAVPDSMTICASELPYTWNGVEFTEAGTQTATLQTVNGCDSVVTMVLTVNPTYAVPDSMTICASELPYTWNEVEFTEAGIQTATLQTVNGCDSVVTMVLTVNPTYAVPDSIIICDIELPYVWNEVEFTEAGTQTVTLQTVNGCDSVVTMVLTVNPTYAVSDTMTICANGLPYMWNNVEFTEAGTQTVTLQTVNGCDSIVTMTLVVTTTYIVSDERDICDNELPYLWNEVEFTAAGTQNVTLQAVNGCDSVVIMFLTVNPIYTVPDSMTICDSELPYIWNEVEFTEAGSQTVTLQTLNGCDSVVTMFLTVNPTYAVPDSMTICDSELPYIWNEIEFIEAGIQTATLQTVNGCDSVVTMVLTVNPTYAVPDSMTICASELPYTWNEIEFTEAGTQTATLQTVNGCDSVVTMVLTVNLTYAVHDSTTICASELPYTWNEVEFTEECTQTATLQTVNGCDSVVAMVLTVNPTYAVSDSMTICDSELPYIWNEIEFIEAGIQTATLQTVNGCDSVVTMVLTVNQTVTNFDEQIVCDSLTWLDGITYYASTNIPTYTYVGGAANGCDSIVTLHLIVNQSYIIEDTLTICENELPYTYGDTVFGIETTSMSVHYIHNSTALACDSITLLTIELVPSSYNTLDTIVLENDLPLWMNGVAYSTDTTFALTFAGANDAGCDSVVTVHINVLYNDMVYVDTTICDNDFPFTWNGVVFTTACTQSVVYTATNGVDSVVTMTVNYNPTTYGFMDTTVLQNDLPFVYYGESYSIPGIYTQTIENAAGCDSVVTINLEEIYNVVAFADTVVCAINTPFEWNGYIFTQTATQMVILPASTGADSMLVMTVTVVYTTYGSMDTTVVENDLPFVWNGESYTTPGYKIQMLSNYAGCDSILTINLHVLYNVTLPADSTVCESALPVIWNGQSFDAEDIQAATHTIIHSALLTASTGVDSTVVMTVVVNPTTYGVVDTTIIENDLPLVLNGESYPVAGTHTQTFSNSNVYECDSVLTIHLTVLNNVTVYRDSILCQTELPLTWNGITFELNTTEPFATPVMLLDSAVLTASTGVDSTVVMTVVVNPTTYGTLDTTILENDLPLLLNGQSYMTDSIFSQTLAGVNSNGCDSMLTVHLTVRYNVTTFLYDTICESQLPFTWNGMTFVADSIAEGSHSFTQSAILTASTGVDSTVVMTVHVLYATTGIDEQVACDSYTWIDGQTYTSSTETATYVLTNEVGCDSVVTLHLTVYHSVTSQDTLVLVENQLPYYFAAADTTITLGAAVESQFSYHLSTIHGCDSLVEQTVIVHYNTSATLDTMVCAASLPYTWHGHVFTEAGVYTDTLLNNNGSSHYLTLHLTVSNPTVTMQNITHINCYGASTGSVGVLVSGGVSPYTPIHWENEAGTTVSTTAQLNNQPAGKYRLFVTDALGCQVTDSVILTHLNDSMVPGVIAANQGVCEGTHLQTFTGTAASGGAGSVYQWQISTNGTTWNPAPAPNNSQNYNYAQAVNSPFSLRRAWISAACGTVYSNVVNVIVYHNVADTIYDVVCQGYPYQDNAFDISATATSTPGVLPCSIHLQSAHGCDSMVTLLLSITPSSYAEESLTICQSELPYTYNDTTFMPGTPHLSTFIFHLSTSEGCDSIHTLHLTVNPVYELNFEDVVCEGDAYDNHGFVVPSTQTVGVPELNLTQQLQSQLDCDSIVNLHLTVVDTSIAIVSLTSDFCEEYSAELSVETNMTNYLWSTGETSPTITVTQPGTYTVTATQDHCSVSTWYQIETCELNVYLPNAITPNDDGINDYFCLHERYLPMIADFEIRIYTRWGELIYYSDDKNFKWNGEYRGRINRNIIYTYLINFTDNRGIPYQLTGTITVL